MIQSNLSLHGPVRVQAVIRGVDFETSQNIDITLPNNYRYRLEEALIISRTATSVSAAPTLEITERNSAGDSVQVIQGAVSLLGDAAGELDEILSGGNDPEYAYLQNIVAAGTTGIITQKATLQTAGTATVAAQPDVPRNLVVTLVDNAGADLAGSVTITGVGIDGAGVSEVFIVVAGTVSYVGSKVFAKVTSVAFDFGATATVTVDTLDVGQGAKLGLGVGCQIIKLVSNGTEEVASAVDATNGSFTPTTAPDGSKDFEVWYRSNLFTTGMTGGNKCRLTIVGSTADADLRDVFLSFFKF